MKRVYLLVHSATLSRDRIKQWADESALVTTWRYDLPNSIYLLSDATAQELAGEVDAFGKSARYLLLEITENRQGRLPPESWYLFRNKRLKSTT